MNPSIKRFLLIYIVLAIILIYGLISSVSYMVSKSELGEVYDTNLQQVANAIAAQHFAIQDITHLYNKIQPDAGKKFQGEETFYVRVLSKDGQSLYISHPNVIVPYPTKFGFSTENNSYEQWRFYTIKVNQEVIQVAQSLNSRKSTVTETALSLMASQLLFIPILIILIFLVIKKSLNPLNQLAKAIHGRRSINLQPFDSDKVPVEIAPLVNELNLFMQRVSEMIEISRRFTSDAAHELRTPITALKLQLTIVEQAKNKMEREQAINMLKRGIERSEQLVSQLLTLARIEPNKQARPLESVDLLTLAKESIEELLPLARKKHIDLGLDTTHVAQINAVRQEIKILINNIVDNAIRYAPNGSKVDILVFLDNQNVILEVNDSGEGISSDDMSHVFERFYRGQNKDTNGSGLGLSIVKEIASQHNANIVMSNLNPGFSFRVYFKRP